MRVFFIIKFYLVFFVFCVFSVFAEEGTIEFKDGTSMNVIEEVIETNGIVKTIKIKNIAKLFPKITLDIVGEVVKLEEEYDHKLINLEMKKKICFFVWYHIIVIIYCI